MVTVQFYPVDATYKIVNGKAQVYLFGRMPDGKQICVIDPHVEPTGFSAGPNGEVVVRIHQTVRDLAGGLLADKMVGHVFKIEDGLIRRFDIRTATE